MILSKNRDNPLTLLYTEIGRGHPAYLDGITDIISRGETGFIWQAESVFNLSTGLSRLFWKLARWLYQHGSSEGMLGSLYARLRQNGDYNQGSLMMTLLGLNIRRHFEVAQSGIVVAHPILVGLLAGRKHLVYQHGETIAPSESLVLGAEMVLVPTQAVADKFMKKGYTKSQLLVTGLCLEPSLVSQAADAFEARLKRLEHGNPLAGVYFSSGAEPVAHVDQLIEAASSSLRSGGRAVLFVKRSGRFETRALSAESLKPYDVELVSTVSELPNELPRLLIVSTDSRSAENRMFAQLFSDFDFIVAPAHERCNYALGLGLPIFMVEPVFGSFAPLNLENILKHRVGLKLGNAEDFGSTLESLREEGELIGMAQAGWQKYDIDGYRCIVDWLIAS